MAQKDLIPMNRRSKDEVKKLGQKGGKASGEARRKKRAAKDVANLILSSDIPEASVKAQLKKMGLTEEDMDMQAALLAATAKRGLSGDVKATEYLIALSDDGKDDVKNYKGIPAEMMGSAFVDIYRDILDRTHRHYDFRGGRGSLKSSFAALIMVDDIMRNPKKCGLALRQVADTMRESIYAQIVWAISVLGLTDEFECTVSPMKCIRKTTGQAIYFRGGNEPDKIKSIKPPENMYIGVLWYEEYDQFRGVSAIRNINQSIMRGGEDFIVLRTYNTPISQRHFVNVEAREDNPRRIIHHSHYKQAPQKWLGEAFWEEAAQLKKINPKAYAHEYDGEATGTGLNVFENIVEREIADDELRTFDRIYYGLDWGWFPHPTAFVECYFNSNTRCLYIFNELCRNKTKNEDLAVLMNDYRNVLITADPGGGGDKSIADFNSWGFNMRPARKGPGSIEYGVKWLQSLTKIIIDPVKCPRAAEQFATYEYLKDKDNNPITGFPDEGDDFIDATRYALESVWRRRGQ